ncbi:unnamed protein product [Adineta steineri]|uniref:Dynein light chain n=1 Tax=Adineta steineri TaxID=433720 RepID=A0A813WPD5_9BILA|nr:unnamed protein product [Adineta steineri]
MSIHPSNIDPCDIRSHKFTALLSEPLGNKMLYKLPEIKTECMELCVTACEKFSQNNENAARMIKETMDKKFGPTWQVIVGEGYGFFIEHQVKSLLYMFFGGTTAIIVWKCA